MPRQARSSPARPPIEIAQRAFFSPVMGKFQHQVTPQLFFHIMNLVKTRQVNGSNNGENCQSISQSL